MKMPEKSFFPTQSGAPQMPQIFSQEALNHAGVKTFGFGKDFSDNYINAQMAQYNNAYNYWLWQQQAMYNSPAEQVKRLKEAGLNPNYNAIEGAGNLKDTPTSKADIHSSAGSSGRENMALTLNYANSILEAVKKGIEMTSDIASLPDDIGVYRNYITKLMGANLEGKKTSNAIGAIQNAFDLYTKLGIKPELNTLAIHGPGVRTPIVASRTEANSFYIDPNWDDSIKFKMLKYQSDAASYLDELRSGQVSINSQRLKNLVEEENILKSDAASRDALNKIKEVSPWVGYAIDILKTILSSSH